jgi:hypothetical protein
MKQFIEKFFAIEQTLAQETGPFKLFALLERATAFDDWDIIMASKGLPDNDMSVLKEVIEKIHAVLTHDEKMKMNAVILLNVNDHFVKEVHKFLAEHHNPTEFSNAEINGLEISRCYIITSPIPQTEPVSPSSKKLLTQAAKWIRKSALGGDSEAQNTLGLMYLEGEGVNKNLNLAKKWFKKAATLGHAQAQQNLQALQLLYK